MMRSESAEDKSGLDDSRALYYSMLLSLAFASSVLLTEMIWGPSLNSAFKFTVCYLPAVILTAIYIERRLRGEGAKDGL